MSLNIIITAIIFIFFSADPLFAQLTYKTLAVQYDSPWVYKDLKLIPVRYKDTSDANPAFLKDSIIGFEQALKEGKVKVREMRAAGGADVSLLEVRNYSNKNVVVTSGEMMAGGKQDRAFAETSIIPPGKNKKYLPVFCLEKGRWDKRPKSFKYVGSADAWIQKQIDVSHKQNKIWKAIDSELVAKNVRNKTWAYLDLYSDTSFIDTSYLQFFKRKMRESDSAYAGFVAITGNRIISCELFGSSDLCLTAYESLIKSYVRSLTPKEGPPQVPDEHTRSFLDKFLETTEQQKKYLSKHGRIYTYQNSIMHLVAYDD